MARLDQIVLKTSGLPAEDLRTALAGTGEETKDKLEPGEVVVRRDKGFFELWSLDVENNPVTLSVDIDLEDQLPPWNSADLENASLGQLGDVSYEDGHSDGIGTDQAGNVLTWNGVTWVVRPPLQADLELGLLPDLNYVGDVDYTFFGEQKPWPEPGDVLQRTRRGDGTAVWAPVPLQLFSFDGITQVSQNPTSPQNVYSECRDGLYFVGWKGLYLSSFGAGLERSGNFGVRLQYIASERACAPKHEIQLESGGIRIQTDASILLDQRELNQPEAEAGIGGPDGEGNPGLGKYELGPTPGIAWPNDESMPLELATDRHLTSLRHVRADWPLHNIGELADVNDANVLQGQVLVWNSLEGQYEPGFAPAGDISENRISELFDVDLDDPLEEGQALIFDNVTQKWINTWYSEENMIPHVAEEYMGHPSTPKCDASTRGQQLLAGDNCYICCLVNTELKPDNQKEYFYAWQKVLFDGRKLGETTYDEVLAEIAYTGQIGSIGNISIDGIQVGDALVWEGNEYSGKFVPGYPNIDKNDISLGELGNVNIQNPSVDYALTYDGEFWVASPIDQKVRLNDLADVQFGTTGVQNNKLVAAYMLVDGDQTGFRAEEDVSTTLAVSSPKADADLGSTTEAITSYDPGGNGLDWLYTRGRLFEIDPDWPIQQKLDNYIYWNLDNSWQAIDGDGCIELFFYLTSLGQQRTILRKEATIGSEGGYLLRVNADASLYWTVNGPTGYNGFVLTTEFNSVAVNTLHHIALTRQAGVNRLYMDGKLLREITNATPWTGNGRFALGRNDLNDANNLTHHFFRGIMFDFRVTRGRAKYTGPTYTIPASIESEIVDTTPSAGDFIQYNGSYWTNVKGVDADISNNSINELRDVDTSTNNPVFGDALVWTGQKWEPGVPGLGAQWVLDDMLDVDTCYQCARPRIDFKQSEELSLMTTFFQDPDDNVSLRVDRSAAVYIQYYDDNFAPCTENPDPFAKYANEQQTYFAALAQGRAWIRARRVVIKNVFGFCYPCQIHETTLHYDQVPNRPNPDKPEGCLAEGYDPATGPEPTFVPPWGVIQDATEHFLNYAVLNEIGNVDAAAPETNQVLLFNGEKWVPSFDVAANIGLNSIDDLRDVDSAGAGNDYFLVYNAATSTWEAKDVIPTSFYDFTAFDIVDFLDEDSPYQFDFSLLKDADQNQRQDNPYNDIYKTKNNDLLDFWGQNSVEKGDGLRGIYFKAQLPATRGGGIIYAPWGLYAIKGSRVVPETNSPIDWCSSTTLLTAPGEQAWMELNARFVRFAGDESVDMAGSSGVRIGRNWRIVYEDKTTKWEEYLDNQVPHKQAIDDYLNGDIFQNLDLSYYDLEDLGNVDTSGKGQGYALTWDATNLKWIASADVAADISLNSIGDLADVEKGENTDIDTNDGWLSFDVGGLRTSRPWTTNSGLDLEASDQAALIGWNEGQPVMENTRGAVSTRLLLEQNGAIRMDASQSLQYTTVPFLYDLSVPTWQQVRQEVVREQTNYRALFLLTGDNFIEQAYNWPVDFTLITAPNPLYDSPFNGHFSYNFLAANSDKIEWTTDNGCPEVFSEQEAWTFEWFMKAGNEEKYDKRCVFFTTFGGGSTGFNASIESVDPKGPNDDLELKLVYKNINMTTVLKVDTWYHVYFVCESDGRIRGFVDGQLIGFFNTTQPLFVSGGLRWGGGVGSDLKYNGQLTNIRITKGWLPYPAEQASIPVPTEPLDPDYGIFGYGTLGSLTDVDVRSEDPTNGQVLMYDGVRDVWYNGPADAIAYDISGNEISDLADVNTNNSVPDDKDILAWDGAELKWGRSKVDGNGGVRPLNQRSSVSGVVPVAGTLFAGELFVNSADKKLWALDNGGVPFSFAQGDIPTEIEKYDRIVGGDF